MPPFNSTVSPSQLATLRQALDDHCNEFGIDDTDAVVCETLANRIMYLFMSGVRTLEELNQGLRSDRLM